jgi:hypothetical protein
MKRRSWAILVICILLAGGLVIAFLMSQGSTERFGEKEAIGMTQKMEQALRNKNVNAILGFFSPTPETRISGINPDQLRYLLVRYFRNSDRLSADMTNYAFTGSDTEATLQFDLVVHNDGSDSRKEDHSGHVTLHLRRVEVPQLMGLYQTKEWRIVGAETTGADLSTFGE